jgi:hypothetical protein
MVEQLAALEVEGRNGVISATTKRLDAEAYDAPIYEPH